MLFIAITSGLWQFVDGQISLLIRVQVPDSLWLAYGTSSRLDRMRHSPNSSLLWVYFEALHVVDGHTLHRRTTMIGTTSL